MSPEESTILNTIIFGLFVFFLLIGTVRTIARALAYNHAGVVMPTLLQRDLISRTGLTVPFTLILTVRAFNLGDAVIGQLWWILLTGIPAVVSVAVYAYYEIFVIDRLSPEDRLARIERKLDENTRVSTDAFHEANTVNVKIEHTNQNIEAALARSEHREAAAERDRVDAKEERRQRYVESDEELRQEGRDLETTAEAHRQEGRDEAFEGDGRPSLRSVVDDTRREVGDLHQDFVSGKETP